MVREELRIGFRWRRAAGVCTRTVEEPSKPGEILTFSGVMESPDKHCRFLRRLLIQVCKHVFQKRGIIRNQQILSSNSDGEIPETVELLIAGLGLPLQSKVAGGQRRTQKIDQRGPHGSFLPVGGSEKSNAGVDANEDAIFVTFRSLGLQDGEHPGFLEKIFERSGGIPGGLRFQRSLIDARFQIGAAASFAGRKLNVRGGLLGDGRASVGGKNLGLKEIEAIRGRRDGFYFVSSGICRDETSQISDGSCRVASGCRSGRGFLQQNTFFAIFLAGKE